MALTTVMPTAAKANFLAGVHLASNAYKMALIKTGHTGVYDKTFVAAGTPGTGAPTTSNIGTDEVTASGSYAAGGFTMIGYTAGNDSASNTAWIDWTTDPNWTLATIGAVGAVIYNDTVAGKPGVSLHDFGGLVSSTAGTFTVTLPLPAAATAVVRLA
jgi:hypothetical protein